MAAIREQEGDSFEPLLQALKQLEFWFAHGRSVPLLLAAPTLEEFKEQQLPVHCEAVRRKIQGPRIPVQGKTQVNRFPTVLARWPNDGLIEGISSTLVFVVNGEADILLSDYRVHCRITVCIVVLEISFLFRRESLNSTVRVRITKTCDQNLTAIC